MGLFGTTTDTAIIEEVDFATSEKNVEEDWGQIMNICDKAGKSSDDAKQYLRAIIKRLNHTDPHVGVKAVTLLDACVKNSGKTFHIEVASRDFETDYTKLVNKAHPTVAKKLRESLRKWSENEFKSDSQLSLIPTLLNKLKSGGMDFSLPETPAKKPVALSKDPNVVETQEEEEQILKAIELSLKETGSPRSATTTSHSTSHTTSLYPSMSSVTTAAAAAPPAKEPRKVRALYDFEAAEDNELTFTSGEIIVVNDDSDPNWWKGSNHRGEGLFPANFVTADLSVEPEKFLFEKAKKMVQFKDTTEVKVVKEEPKAVEIDENKIDRLLHLLHEADPTNPEKDTEEMLNLEGEVNAMGPLIDSELEKVDRKHAQLTQLSGDLVESLGLYHTLMREPSFPTLGKMSYGFPPNAIPFSGGLPPPSHMMMQGPPGMPPDRAGQFLPPSSNGSGMPPHYHLSPQISNQQLPPSQMQQMMHPNAQMALQMAQQQQQQQHQQQQQQQQQQVPDEKKFDPSMMMYPGVGNYGPPSSLPPTGPNFPAGIPSQTNIQNGPQQLPGIHYVTSSTHMTH